LRIGPVSPGKPIQQIIVETIATTGQLDVDLDAISAATAAAMDLRLSARPAFQIMQGAVNGRKK
jgi:hypothetical protein